ncbi:hypothetical protein Poli38472_006057 [Pythium oligandrum]|uniref:Phosphodiesterase n=1 Tax=Pythium oligandrum TaxID=41045 RepID=A0A8K1CS64_PYTOL|nr:hypothetical protein Poli38472_006057 [Pythium oligandrum]|eukprot:TMW68589.1 hypothetical protein Poli38472_006057 [Pythium oligandrum]
MGNEQSSARHETRYTSSATASGKMPASATAAASWLSSRMTTTNLPKPSVPRFGSMKEKKPHAMSEAVTEEGSTTDSPQTMEQMELLSDNSAQEDASTFATTEQPERESESDVEEESVEDRKETPTSLQKKGVTSLQKYMPCIGGFCAKPTTSTPRHQRKRPRAEPLSPKMVEEKHHAFWELVQKLLNLNDVVAMINVLHEYLEEKVGASQSAFFLVDPNTNTMARVQRGQATVSGLSLHRGLVGHIFSTQEPFSRQLFEQDLHFDPAIDLPQESVFQKLLCVPLLDNGNVYAIVQVTTRTLTTSEVDELDVKLLTWLGPILSSCMRKCIEYHDVLLSERTQKALLHIISSSDTDDTVLNLVDGVISGARHITKAERLSLFMIDWENEELWTLSSSCHEETARIPLEGSALGFAAQNQVTLNVADPKNDLRFMNCFQTDCRNIPTRCALYVPVGTGLSNEGEHHDRPMAVLEILNKADGTSFTLDDESAFEAFACEVAVILRRRSNEIQYIKLLADTRAEKVLAQRAKSQVNLLECFTEIVASASTNHAADLLRHSFGKNHSGDRAPAPSSLLSDSDPYVSRDGHGPLLLPPSTTLVTNSYSMPAVMLSKETENAEFSSALTVVPSKTVVPLWDFNIFACEAESLPTLVRDIFLDFRLDEILHTDATTMRNFILAVKESYHPNPFHNYLHAVSVLHSTYAILKTTKASQMLQPLDIAACLVAAYCHDVDHPGHTNSFEIVSKSQLALLYSDESVLERHHACTTFRIMSRDKNVNILQNLSAADFSYIRKMIVSAILGTDMSQHFKTCEALEKMLHPVPHSQMTSAALATRRESLSSSDAASVSKMAARNGDEGSSAEILSVVRDAVFHSDPSISTSGLAPTCTASSTKSLPSRALACSSIESSHSSYDSVFNGTLDERVFLVKCIVHTSDLCGQVFPKPVALKWSNLVSKEFAYQALLEQAENLPVSHQHMDDPLQMVEGQHFFAHKIVSPLWTLMHQMFPELDVCIENLHANVAHYEQEMERLKQHHRRLITASSEASGCCSPGGLCLSDDEGMAVPGESRCTPARFNSFRVTRSISTGVPESSKDVIDAIAQTWPPMLRTRSSSTVSNSDEEEEVEEVEEVSDMESLAMILPCSS